MTTIDSPIPLSDIESVLAWVDTFKLSRATKKINRDFSDAVLLAEILNVHYPKLVEMHNYPPRNSHSLKLNNWLTLNRKVLKKLKLNLCINTMEQLANCNNGVIERVLVMVREKIRRDEEINRSMRDAEQNMSSGGSFYEACGDEENVLVVPMKTRVNGVLETVQQKVVNYEMYSALKEELKDAKDATELLKQKVDHLDNLLKLKDERIDELQKQLERKQARRKEAEAFQNSLQIPFETVPSPQVPNINENAPAINLIMKTSSVRSLEAKPSKEESNISLKPSPYVSNTSEIAPAINLVMKTASIKSVEAKPSKEKSLEAKPSKEKYLEAKPSKEESKIPVKSDSIMKSQALSQPSLTEVSSKDAVELDKQSNINMTNSSYTKFPNNSIVNTLIPTIDTPFTVTIEKEHTEDYDYDVDRIKSDVFKEIEIIDERLLDMEEFKDSVQDDETSLTTIEESIQNEIKTIIDPMGFMMQNFSDFDP